MKWSTPGPTVIKFESWVNVELFLLYEVRYLDWTQDDTHERRQ